MAEQVDELPVLIPASELNLPVEEPDGASNGPGYVYCIAEVKKDGEYTGNFKVGTTTNPKKRLNDLQTGNINQLRFVGNPIHVSHSIDMEKKAHTALQKYKVDQGGGTEWFQASSDSERKSFYKCYKKAVK